MKDKGMALVTIIMMSVLLLILGLSISSIAVANNDIAKTIRFREKALNAAEAGIARAFCELNDENNVVKDFKIPGRGESLKDEETKVFDDFGKSLDKQAGMPERFLDLILEGVSAQNKVLLDDSPVITGIMEDGQTIFAVFLINSSGTTGFNGETIPNGTFQIISIGMVVGNKEIINATSENKRKKNLEKLIEKNKLVTRTISVFAKKNILSTYACASSGSLKSVEGDFIVDGIDSLLSWNKVDGNIHTCKPQPSPTPIPDVDMDKIEDKTFLWDGGGVYEAEISGKITSAENKDNIAFYENLSEDKEYKKIDDDQIDQANLIIPPPPEEMLPPQDEAVDLTLVETLTTNPDGNVILKNGNYKITKDLLLSKKPNGKGGKLILQNANLYVVGEVNLEGGIEGSGVLSCTGVDETSTQKTYQYVIEDIDIDDDDHNDYYWEIEPGYPVFVPDSGSSFNEIQDNKRICSPKTDNAARLADSQIIATDASYILAWNYYDYSGWQDLIPDGMSAEQLANMNFSVQDQLRNETNMPADVHLDHDKVDDREFRIWLKSDDVKTEENYDRYNNGKWVYKWRKVYRAEVDVEMYEVGIYEKKPVTINGNANIDTTNIHGVSVYSDGKIILQGKEDAENTFSPIKKALQAKIVEDIQNGLCDPNTLAHEYLVDTMEIQDLEDTSVTYQLTGITEYLKNHPALYFTSVGDLVEVKDPANETDKYAKGGKLKNPQFLNAITHHVANYMYFQGIIYSRSGIEANGKIKILGAAIVNSYSSSNDAKCVIDLKKGANFTSVQEYQKIFRDSGETRYSPIGWHEVRN
ncbi:MAG: hypothetical protein ACLFQV_03175 [Vulcanimicrobiota bacterium]